MRRRVSSANSFDSVNLIKIKTAAHRTGRTAEDLKYGWLNPFNRYSFATNRRANTYSVAEEGKSSGHETSHLHQVATAPGSLRGPVQPSRPSRDIDPMTQADDMYDSPATTAGSPETAQSEGLPRQRRKILGVPVGGAEPEEDGVEDYDSKAERPNFTFANQIQRTLFSSWINVLLLAAPAGIVIWALKIPGPAVFVVNFIAIIPLAAMLSYSTEQIALRTGDVLGGLINATFGNAVELIVAIIALLDNQVTVVQTSLVGSVLSNLLLVLGFCFVAGGFNRAEQFFNSTVAQTAASLLALSVASLIVPTIFSHTPDLYSDDKIDKLSPSAVPQLSRGVSVILLLIYASYLLFQLKTHSSVFNEESQKVATKDVFKRRRGVPKNPVASGVSNLGANVAGVAAVRGEDGQLSELMRAPMDEEGPEVPELHFWVAVATLTLCTVVIALCAEGLVSGIEPIAESVSEEFIGLILIPIVGNACEHATAVTVAVKDKMDLAIGVAIGSSMQVALFLIPLLVIIGWGIGNEEMTLAFDTFQVVTLFVSVLLVNYLIGDGKSHWLEGVQLIALYVIIAVCAFYYPNGTGVPVPS
ncbi:Calcium/proton exchanger [Poronia punctata]|nr:Calcium/proton exchanger [Poronia punctata]